MMGAKIALNLIKVFMVQILLHYLDQIKLIKKFHSFVWFKFFSTSCFPSCLINQKDSF